MSEPTPPVPDDSLEPLLEAAAGERPADLVLRGGRLLNVLSGEVLDAEVAVQGDRVAGVAEHGTYDARRSVDASGQWVTPGLLDGHVHLESSLVTLPEFARALLPRGVTGAVLDPHEVANVHGLAGIRWLLDSRRGVPFRAYVMASSCVPSTPLETAGAELDADDLEELYDEEGVLGLAEMMNYPGVLARDPGVLAKLERARSRRLVVDGHAPGVRGLDLNAYLAAGPGSDHESTGPDEAREKLRRGARLMIREASTAHNLDDLLPVVNGRNERRCCLVTDDRHPDDLMDEGGVDHAVRRAIAGGLDPVSAFRMATLNTAEWFGLDRRGIGALAPGWRADLLLLDDLESVDVAAAWVGGRHVASGGSLEVELPSSAPELPPSVHLDPGERQGFPVPSRDEEIRVIEIVPGQLVTGESVEEPTVEDGRAVADPRRDLLKAAVLERHGAGGGAGLGFVRGLGMERGALGSTVAHDAHNLVLAGADDRSMVAARDALARSQGGLAVATAGEVHELLPLPVAGLMADRPLAEVRRGLDRLHAAYEALGGALDSPFMALSFLTLAVIPSLKLTDRGLVDVDSSELVDLWVSR